MHHCLMVPRAQTKCMQTRHAGTSTDNMAPAHTQAPAQTWGHEDHWYDNAVSTQQLHQHSRAQGPRSSPVSPAACDVAPWVGLAGGGGTKPKPFQYLLWNSSSAAALLLLLLPPEGDGDVWLLVEATVPPVMMAQKPASRSDMMDGMMEVSLGG